MKSRCAETLNEAQRWYLANLPDTARVDLGTAGDLLAFHGSPRSADDFLTPTASMEELGEMFAGASASILAGGHTHVPLIRRYGTSTIVNPGSVGLPFAEYGYAGAVTVLPHAAYADRRHRGRRRECRATAGVSRLARPRGQRGEQPNATRGLVARVAPPGIRKPTARTPSPPNRLPALVWLASLESTEGWLGFRHWSERHRRSEADSHLKGQKPRGETSARRNAC